MGSSFISFAGQTRAQSNRLLNLRTSLFDLQRQIATQKKADDFSGLGTEAGTVQRLRTESNELDSYKQNIDRTSLRSTIMGDAMLESVKVAREVINSMRLQTREGNVDMGAIRTVAKENLRFLQDLMNSTNNGTYVFAGNDVRNAPLDSLNTLNTNAQIEVNNWLTGSQTPTQLLSNVQAMSGTTLGYSSTIQAAGDVFAKVDTSVEINYTVKADSNAFSDLVKGIALAANLQQPDPAVDVATDTEFFQIYDEIITTLARGVKNLEAENFDLASKTSLMNSIKERHIQDGDTLQIILDETENIDTSEIIVKLQSLDNQLSASYEVTRILNELTLINFI